MGAFVSQNAQPQILENVTANQIKYVNGKGSIGSTSYTIQTIDGHVFSGPQVRSHILKLFPEMWSLIIDGHERHALRCSITKDLVLLETNQLTEKLFMDDLYRGAIRNEL